MRFYKCPKLSDGFANAPMTPSSHVSATKSFSILPITARAGSASLSFSRAARVMKQLWTRMNATDADRPVPAMLINLFLIESEARHL